MPLPSSQLALDRSLREIDRLGRMHVEVANISKAMVCPYKGKEIPDSQALGLDPEKIYMLYRDPAELQAAVPTFKRLPLLIIHKAINAADPGQEYIGGTTGDEVKFEFPYLKASLSLWTEDAVKLVVSRKQEELSCGYNYRCDLTPGVADGVSYDGVMRNIVGNHLTIVEEGRCGPDVVVPDELPTELKKMRFPNISAAIKQFLKPDADMLALDEALASAADAESEELTDKEKKDAEDAALDAKRAKDGAKDAELTEAEKEAAREKAKDKKAADRKAAKDKAAKDKAAKDKKAKDEKNDENFNSDSKAKDGTITADEMNAAIKVAQDAAIVTARTQITALYAAREACSKVLGPTIACDSADEVYALALKKMGVKTEGVSPSAYRALFDLAQERAKPQRIALDSANDSHGDAQSIFPQLANLRRG